MKSFIALLPMASTLFLSGCATTGHETCAPVNGMGGVVQKQPSPTDDMTPVQKTGYYLGWFSLPALYAWAGSGPAIHP